MAGTRVAVLLNAMPSVYYELKGRSRTRKQPPDMTAEKLTREGPVGVVPMRVT